LYNDYKNTEIYASGEFSGNNATTSIAQRNVESTVSLANAIAASTKLWTLWAAAEYSKSKATPTGKLCRVAAIDADGDADVDAGSDVNADNDDADVDERWRSSALNDDRTTAATTTTTETNNTTTTLTTN